MPRNFPTEPVALHHQTRGAHLLPLRLVLGSYLAVQLCRERRWVGLDMLKLLAGPRP